jgi:hypothetical protein
MKKRSSQQLNTGTPSAFDHSTSSDLVAVSSDNNIFLFNFDWQGNKNASPRQIIFYEQPQTISHLKFQKGIPLPLLSVVCGGLTSIWDPAKTSTPLNHFVPTMGYTTDIQWSIFSNTTLTTATDHGALSMWDIRVDSKSFRPASQFSLGLKEPCSAIQYCPSSEYLISCLSRGEVVIWDVRKPSFGKNNVTNPATDASCYGKIPSTCFVNQYVWGPKDQALYTWTSDNKVGYWQRSAAMPISDLDYIQHDNSPKNNQPAYQATNSSSFSQYTQTHSFHNMETNSSGGMLIAEPSGKGVILSVHTVHTAVGHASPAIPSKPTSVSLRAIGMDAFTDLALAAEEKVNPSTSLVLCHSPGFKGSYATVAHHSTEIVGMQWSMDVKRDFSTHPSLVVLTESAVLHTLIIDAGMFNCRSDSRGGESPSPFMPTTQQSAKVYSTNSNSGTIAATPLTYPVKSRFPLDRLKSKPSNVFEPKPIGIIKSNKKARQEELSLVSSSKDMSQSPSNIPYSKSAGVVGGVVGPRTFLSLVKDAIQSLELSIVSGLLGGCA